ncbi:MAG: hypothetical protein V4857_11695 [Pseudomonadota bacterium]
MLEVKLKNFEIATAEKIRLAFPEQTAKLDAAVLAGFIRQGVDLAENYAIERAEDVQSFLLFAVQYGLDVRRYPQWAGLILLNAELTGSEKVEQINSTQLDANKGELSRAV